VEKYWILDSTIIKTMKKLKRGNKKIPSRKEALNPFA
jgi:hypothetical protein